MRVHIEKEGKKLRFDFDGPVSLLLRKLDLNPEEVIVTRNDEIISGDDSVRNKDLVKISSIVSGRA